jgi:signal peptidase I
MARRKDEGILRDYLIAVGLAVSIALLIRFFLIEAYRIPSSAMRPTLESGDTIFVAKSAYGLKMPFAGTALTSGSMPERGDVVVFATHGDPDFDYIKRVVAVTGDQVEVRNGLLILNGQALASEDAGNAPCLEETLPGRPPHRICREAPLIPDYGPATVPERSVFVLGDLRSEIRTTSLGSVEGAKFKGWGMIRVSALKGKALWIWLSIEPGSIGRGRWFPQIRFERMLRRIQ